ncbi:MAG: exodeoxyribonuclease VII large subunit, partial [Gammaproteobacteria bacterium]|nr:exodeoxyribonuclease VII large subunit [Gammaproteobacteria bacterium]
PFRDVYTVSRLNRETRQLLEGGFPLLWLEGEISNLARPASGHLYFSLKDNDAQVRCAMFRNRNMNLPFRPDNGMQVLVRAKVGFYEPRGEFQIIVEHMEESGHGALQRAFEALKQKLNAAGLFDAAHKQPLPPLPGKVGVITSPSGAAVHDILTTLRRRFPALPVIIYPVPVQGSGAAEQIAAMIRLADQRRECDVLLLARGGGSLEDLWAFNEEVVARAIYDCTLPLVTGIGHEVDFTIADFVADYRAPTPTGAAELISPDQQEWLSRLHYLQQRLGFLARNQLARMRQHWQAVDKRLQHPGRRLRDSAQRLDELELRLQRAQQNLFRHAAARYQQNHAILLRHNPVQRISAIQKNHDHLLHRLQQGMQHKLQRSQDKFRQLTHALDTVSPLATLSRGYAIVRTTDGTIVRQASQVKPGDSIRARVAEGELYCDVKQVMKSDV